MIRYLLQGEKYVGLDVGDYLDTFEEVKAAIRVRMSMEQLERIVITKWDDKTGQRSSRSAPLSVGWVKTE